VKEKRDHALDLHYLLYSGGVECVCITEYWLNSHVTAGVPVSILYLYIILYLYFSHVHVLRFVSRLLNHD